MSLGTSLHAQYYDTSLKGHGLRRAFDILKRKGLASTRTQGPFHQTMEEALYHIAEAHILTAWLTEGRVETLSQLHHKSPDDLLALAETIMQRHASTEALNTVEARDEIDKSAVDDVEREVIMFSRDVLQYIVLDEAVKHGRIGVMEDMLPHLFYRFSGGGSPKYAIECYELLQGLHREWPREVA